MKYFMFLAEFFAHRKSLTVGRNVIKLGFAVFDYHEIGFIANQNLNVFVDCVLVYGFVDRL